MHFHHHGYVRTDPRLHEAQGVGADRPQEIPDEFDVLIVGTGPAGIITAAQLAQFPEVSTRIIERRPGRLEIGQADGLQKRSFETFQAFGFADRLIEEAYWITESAFWNPDPEDPRRIARSGRLTDDPDDVSEFPHMVVNQARVIDYFVECMAMSGSRMAPDYGVEFVDAQRTGDGEYPLKVTLRYTAGEREGREHAVRVKYLIGADGARSGVRRAIGGKLEGQGANHAWGVLDILANTDFPDIRLRSVIHSASEGNILLIPREGGHLVRVYVDLGVVGPDGSETVRETTVEEMIDRANAILHPYHLDVKNVPWSSVYEVGHRIADRFDDAGSEMAVDGPRVFILGDACHTHSAKAGQGMNVSMQDGFNLAWKLGHVLTGRAPTSLLETYATERRVIAQDLIDFDREWSSLMAKPSGEGAQETDLVEFSRRSVEFPAGLMTQYSPSQLTGGTEHQHRAAGFPVGKRFRSARVTRVCDGNPLHLGHLAKADGRWRVYAFADADGTSGESAMQRLGDWLTSATESPLVRFRPTGADLDSFIEVKAIYQQGHHDIHLANLPEAFTPAVGPFSLTYLENVFAVLDGEDIYDLRQIDRSGAVIIVRPDQYVAAVLPLDDTAGLARFFDGVMVDPTSQR